MTLEADACGFKAILGEPVKLNPGTEPLRRSFIIQYSVFVIRYSIALHHSMFLVRYSIFTMENTE